jgi:hypothetical protein
MTTSHINQVISDDLRHLAELGNCGQFVGTQAAQAVVPIAAMPGK